MGDTGPAANQFVQTNIAIWVLTGASGIFLVVRLWCRKHFSQLWYDDAMLTLSWLSLLVSSALLSRAMASGPMVGKESDMPLQVLLDFFRYHQISTTLACIATSWSKVAFAITLTRLTQSRVALAFLYFIMISANLVLFPGILSIWFPQCRDPFAKFRPTVPMCWSGKQLRYMGGTFIVYGGVVDLLLALVPWLIIRKLRLRPQEKFGALLAMSLGAITGVVVILRAVLQFKLFANRYYGMAFLSMFNAMEPSVTIVAQTIPIFRVLMRDVKLWSSRGRRDPMNSSRTELVIPKYGTPVSSHADAHSPIGNKGHELHFVTERGLGPPTWERGI